MTAKNDTRRTDGRGGNITTGIAAALSKTNPDDYASTQEAIQAALETVPRFRCRNCREEAYAHPPRCRHCGGTRFRRVTP